MKKNCKKKKLDKIGAMLVIADAQKLNRKKITRGEKNYYWCKECNCYHTTSQK